MWRMLPHDYPPHDTVWSFYRRARENGVWDKMMKHLVKITRKQAGRNEEPSYALIDSQSVKTTCYGEDHGYDGEKMKGRKRHIVTDTMGNLLCIHVHAANIHDTKGGVYTFEKALYRYPTIQAGCALNLVSQAQYKRISKKRLMFRAALEPTLFLDILFDPSSVSPQK